MKKIFALGWMLVAALALTNCSKEETVAPEVEGQAFELFASTNGTRTTMADLKTSWKDGDAMNVWTATTEGYQSHGQFTISDVENGKFTGTLDASFDKTTANDWYVMYPYNEKVLLPDGSNYMYVGHTAPKQDGNNSQAHLSGSSAPLYGVAKAVAGSETPVFQMHHLSTFVRVRVTNNTANPFSVASVYLTSESELYLVGSYYVNITGDEVVYTPSGGTYTKTEVTLTVNNGEEIAVGEQAEFYLPLAPIQFGEADEMLTVDITTTEGATISVEKTIPAGTKFAAGKLNTLKVEATEDNIEYPVVADPYTIPFEDNFSWLSEHTDSESAEMAIDLFPEYYSEVLKLYDTNDYLKVGTGSVRGYFKTAQFDLSQDFVVVVKAMTYGTDASTISVTVDDETATAQTLTGAFKYYEFPFTAKSTNSTVTVNINGKRGYVSYFAILKEFTLPPVINANPTNINVDDKGVTDALISYTIENPVENEALQASVDATWVHLGQAVDGTLTYSVDPYTEEGADARNCNITLSYTGAETVVIPVSQTAPASSSATTIEYVFSEEGYTNAQDLTTAPIAIDSNISLTFTNGGNNNGPKYYNTGTAARMYPKNTMDVVASNGKVIKQITLAFSASNYMGTFVLDGYSGNTWTGSATNVLFTNTASSGHARIQKITVIYE